jgi:polyphosphate kinase 2 (PPK2 family)
MATDRRSHYPSRANILAIVEAARAAGLDVAAIEVSAHGNIRVLDVSSFPSPPRDEWEEYERAGLLG